VNWAFRGTIIDVVNHHLPPQRPRWPSWPSARRYGKIIAGDDATENVADFADVGWRDMIVEVWDFVWRDCWKKAQLV